MRLLSALASLPCAGEPHGYWGGMNFSVAALYDLCAMDEYLTFVVAANFLARTRMWYYRDPEVVLRRVALVDERLRLADASLADALKDRGIEAAMFASGGVLTGFVPMRADAAARFDEPARCELWDGLLGSQNLAELDALLVATAVSVVLGKEKALRRLWSQGRSDDFEATLRLLCKAFTAWPGPSPDDDEVPCNRTQPAEPSSRAHGGAATSHQCCLA